MQRPESAHSTAEKQKKRKVLFNWFSGWSVGQSHHYVFFIGLFEVRALQYLETIPESEPSGVNRILRSLGELLCSPVR